MSVKFKLGFTVSAETLFTLMSKLLPIEDLSVEEVIERPSTPLADRAIALHQKQFLAKPKPKPKPKHRINPRYPDGPNLKMGINGIIVRHLSNGMGHNASELRKALKTGGYSESSLSSRIEELRKHGVVENLGQGTWRLTDKHLNSEGVQRENIP